jgi:hydroxymethylbilane synthase
MVIPPGRSVQCVTKRENPFDVLISGSGQGLKDLSTGARIGTSSIRQQARLLRFRADFMGALKKVGRRNSGDPIPHQVT